MLNDNFAAHIHLARPEKVELANAILLENAEHSRADAFKFPQDRELYLASHIFLRQTLSKYAAITPEAWAFKTNKYGKPFITNPGYEDLQFNLSHTQGLIACAISHGCAIGVDVEKCRPIDDLDALCRYALSPLEAHDVLSISNPIQKEERFFTYWTLKEAYIKAKGMGLSIPLQQFTLMQGSDLNWQLHVEGDASFRQKEKVWQFATKRMETHHISTSIQRKNDEAPHFIFHTDLVGGETSSFV